MAGLTRDDAPATTSGESRLTARGLAGTARSVLPVAVPAAVLLALALYQLDAKSFWFDEVFSVQTARSGLRGIAAIAASGEANMLLYYVVLRPWLAIADGDAWIRLLSVIFAVATVPVIYLLGRAVADRTVAALAALLFAVNGFVVQYAQEARSYSLTMLLVSATLLGAVLAVRDRRRSAWAVFVVSAALAAYAHIFAGLTIAAIGAAALLFPIRGGDRGAMLRALLLVGGLLLPIAAVLALRQGSHLGWVPPTTPDLLAQTLAVVAGAGVVPGRETPWSWLLTVAVFGLAAVGIASRRAAGPSGDGAAAFTRRLLVLAVVVPLVGGLLISLVKPVFVPRFFAVVVPPLVVLAALGLAGLRPRARALAFVAVAALALQGTWTWYVGHPKTDWRAAVGSIAEQAVPGDRFVVYEEWNRRAIQYYAAQGDTDAPFPTRLWHGLGATDPDAYATALEAVLREEVPPGSRVWLILASGARGRADPADARFGPLRARYRMGPIERFDGLSVVRFDPLAP